MNCRRVNNLLSAYIDKELTGEEMRAVRAHLEYCYTCQAEHEELLQTKKLLAALAVKMPRNELEAALLTGIEHEAKSPLRRWFPTVPALLYQWADQWEVAVARLAETQVRPNTVAATLLLSVAGLWAASTVVDRSEHPPMHFGPEPVLVTRSMLADTLPSGFGLRGDLSSQPMPVYTSNVYGSGRGVSVLPAMQGGSPGVVSSAVAEATGGVVLDSLPEHVVGRQSDWNRTVPVSRLGGDVSPVYGGISIFLNVGGPPSPYRGGQTRVISGGYMVHGHR
ncbi:MAG: hypothetical protein OHK0029_27110 [Armatimonadaceae bacterium]